MAAQAARDPAQEIIDALLARSATLSTAESCTGGLVAAALTAVAGASGAYFGGYVTYDNAAKTQMVRVPARLIRDHGAVSSAVARAMADGARNSARTDFAIATTGIAGPGGATEKKPVGLVYVAVSWGDDTRVVEKRFGDIGRQEVREATVEAALTLMLEVLADQTP